MPPKYMYTVIDKNNNTYKTTSIYRFVKDHNIKSVSHLYSSIKTKKFIKGWLLINKEEII